MAWSGSIEPAVIDGLTAVNARQIRQTPAFSERAAQTFAVWTGPVGVAWHVRVRLQAVKTNV
jgi:hypothetical protein